MTEFSSESSSDFSAVVLPEPLSRWFAADPRAEDDAVLVITSDESGEPRIAQLGRPQVLVVKPGRVAMATWTSSATTANLRRSGRCALYAVADGITYTVELETSVSGPLRLAETQLTGFVGVLRQVRVDEVSYATVTSGVRYRLHSPGETLGLWAELRAALERAT
jgi:hypothetical protein